MWLFLQDHGEGGAQDSASKIPNPVALVTPRLRASWGQPLGLDCSFGPLQTVAEVGILSPCTGHTAVSNFQTSVNVCATYQLLLFDKFLNL